MRERWQVKELIDLEYLLHLDGKIEDLSALRERDQRDRNIYLGDIEPKLGKKVLQGSEKRNFILRQWLECRKKIEDAKGAVLPGELFSQAYNLLSWLFIAAGGMLGAGTALSLLVYSGDRPVNVTLYFSALVLVQMILLLVLAGYMILWHKSRRGKGLSVFQPLIGAFCAKLMTRVLEKTGRGHRDSILYAVALVKGKTRVYGSLFHWPLFMIAQVFGIAFNIGVLCATLFRVLSVDLAFGWQSTVQFGSAAVYRIVSVISLPWAWALPSPVSHPTLEQISGSRMVLKEGIYPLTTGDLVSWWPFLCLAVLFYGFLPRVVLFMAGKIALNSSLSRLGFNTIACERLLHRLATPLFDIRGVMGGTGGAGSSGGGRDEFQRADAPGAEKKQAYERQSSGFERPHATPPAGAAVKNGRGAGGIPSGENIRKSALSANTPHYIEPGSMDPDKPQQESMEVDRASLPHLPGLKSGNGSPEEPLTAHGPADSGAEAIGAGEERALESVDAYYRKPVSEGETGKHSEEYRGMDILQDDKTASYPPDAYPAAGERGACELDRGELQENSGKEKTRDSVDFYEETPVCPERSESDAEPVVALVSEDIIDDCPDRELERVVFENFGCRLAGIRSVSFDLDEDEAHLSPLALETGSGDRSRVFVLQEGWQPPIRETLLFYRGLRELLGEDVMIFVGLIGKPVPDTIFTLVDEENLFVWNREMGKLGDPQLLVERLLYR